MGKIIGAIIAVIVLAGGTYFATYNGLIAKDEACAEAEREIDNQLQRRYDLIPGYVAIVKKFAKHEEKIFTAVSEARAAMMGAKGMADKAAKMQAMDGAFAKMMAVAENYPQLKSNENFLKLQDEYAGTENRISVARGRYNAAVKAYNTATRTFPGSMFKMEKRDYFEAPVAKADLQKTPDMNKLLD